MLRASCCGNVCSATNVRLVCTQETINPNPAKLVVSSLKVKRQMKTISKHWDIIATSSIIPSSRQYQYLQTICKDLLHGYCQSLSCYSTEANWPFWFSLNNTIFVVRGYGVFLLQHITGISRHIICPKSSDKSESTKHRS